MLEDIETITAAERATEDAELATEAAGQSAVAATAAAINQAAIIDIVTASAREDAQRARDQAELAAGDAKNQAELTTIIAETAIAEMKSMLEEHNKRINALESKSSEPQVSVISNEPVATPINPQETEQAERSEDMESGGEEKKSSSRKRHGRRRPR